MNTQDRRRLRCPLHALVLNEKGSAIMNWIDRKDREPLEDGWYLVCDMETAPYLPDRAEREGGEWSPVQGDEEFVITHWMELPPPPFEVDWDDDDTE